jgi:O-antigen/teichoic acid export membrane protein
MINFIKNIKRSDSRTVKWNLFFNYSSIIYNVIIAIALVPLYLKYIPSEVYGLWLATGNILIWMTLLDPGLGATMQYKIAFAIGENKKKEIGKLIGNSFIISFFFLFVLFIAIVILQYNINSWLNMNFIKEDNFMLALALTSFSTVLMVFSFNIQGINFGLQSSLGVGIVFTIMNIVGIGVTIYLLKNGYGLLAFGYAGMIRALIYLIGNLCYMLIRIKSDNYKISYDKSGLKELIKLFSISFVGKITGTLQGRVFEFLIAKYISYSTVTNFKMTLNAPENSKIILIRPSVSISPVISKLIGSGEVDEIKIKIRQLFLFFIWASMFIFSAFLIFNENFINLWIGKSFFLGKIPNLLICILIIVASLSEILAQIVWSIGEIKKNNIATFFQFVLFLPLAIFSSINYGIIGLLSAAILSYILVTISYFSWLIINKFAVNKKNIFTLLKEIVISTVIISCLYYFFQNQNSRSWIYFIINCTLFVFCFGFMLLVLSKKFRSIIIGKYNSVFNKIKF